MNPEDVERMVTEITRLAEEMGLPESIDIVLGARADSEGVAMAEGVGAGLAGDCPPCPPGEKCHWSFWLGWHCR